MLLAICCVIASPQDAKPITFPTGRIAQVVTASLGTTGSAKYTLAAKAGQNLVVNAAGTTPGFGVIATVTFPGGGQDGQKGTPSYAGKLTKSGTVTITVSRNLMANSTQKGSYVLEVVLY